MSNSSNIFIPAFEECKNQAFEQLNYFLSSDEAFVENANRLIPSLNKLIRNLKNHKFKQKASYTADKFLKTKFSLPLTNQNYLKAGDESILYFYLRDNGINIPFSKVSPPILIVRNKIRKLQKKRNLDFSRPETILSIIPEILEDSDLTECLEWIKEKLDRAVEIIPKPVLEKGALGKLGRTIHGVILYKVISPENSEKIYLTKEEIFKALKAGYYFGLTYALCDDLLDSNTCLSGSEKSLMIKLVEKGLSGKKIEDLEVPDHPVASELFHVFSELKKLFPLNENRNLYVALQNLHKAQAEEYNRDFSNHYSNEELFSTTIIKAAYTRIVPALLAENKNIDNIIGNEMFLALNIQLIDDFRDFYIDENEGVFSPFRYKIHGVNKDKISNPLLLYLSSIYKIIEYYKHHPQVERLLVKRLGQAVNHFSEYELRKVLDLFLDTNSRLKEKLLEINKLGKYLLDPEGKIISDLTNYSLLKEKNQYGLQNVFEETKNILNPELSLNTYNNNKVVDSMNYSLQAGGKRIRPALALIMARIYGIEDKKILPFLKAIESSHTASLIFDDLPAQDNAKMRRGVKTNHQAFPEHTSQLAGISLILKSFNDISKMDFAPERITQVVEYCSELMGHKGLSYGQQLDLSAHVNGTIKSAEQIEKMYFLKSGLALEMSLVPVAIFANRPDSEIEVLKAYAKHLGIAYQIRDDLNDNNIQNGKDTNIDKKNNRKTIISLVGEDQARLRFEHHIKKAKEALLKVDVETRLLKEVVDYLVEG
jgi:geranylgeranyl pyrophosphate synthase